jgi:ribonuclease PH
MKNIGHYSKAVVALLLAGLSAISLALADGKVSTVEWVSIATAVVTAVGVGVVPNSPKVDPAPAPIVVVSDVPGDEPVVA